MPYDKVNKNYGPPVTPQEIKRLRRQVMDATLRVGQPVIHRHVYGLQDVDSGVAKICPACFDPVYLQTRFDCPVCYGQGFVSVEDNPDPIWITVDGLLLAGLRPPGSVPAPRYGGFGKPSLTYIIEPDVAVDVFRLNEQGALVQQYDAQAMAPWTPTMGDNDLIINVELGKDDFTTANNFDRYSLKMAQQVTIRGFGRRQRGSFNGNPFLVAQKFEMNKVPLNNILLQVPVDEIWY